MERKIKIKVLNKLIDAGFNNNKSIENLTMEQSLKISNITLAELKYIVGIQKAIKNGCFVEYLAEDEETDSE